jgi:hypothetical protein
MSARQTREDAAIRFANHLGVDSRKMVVAADAVWSNLNPQTYSYERALSIAGAVLVALKKYCDPVGGESC